MSNENKESNPEQRLSNYKYFSSKRLFRYQTNTLLLCLKFTLRCKRNNIELKSNIQNYTSSLQLAEFFQNKEANDSVENLLKNNPLLLHQEIGIEI